MHRQKQWMTQKEYAFLTSKSPIPGVDLVILRKEGNAPEILLIKNKIERVASGKWGLIGGRQWIGETLRDTVNRQASELGLKVKIITPFRYDFPAMVNSSLKQDTHKQPLCCVYPVEVIKGKLRKKGTEFTNTKWFGIDKLPKLALDQAREVELVLHRLKWIGNETY